MLYAEDQIFFCLLIYQFVSTTTAQSALFFTAQKPSSLWNGALNFTPEVYSSSLLSYIKDFLDSARDLGKILF